MLKHHKVSIVATLMAIVAVSPVHSQENKATKSPAKMRVVRGSLRLGEAQAHARGLSQAFHEAAKTVRPSVVTIHSERRIIPKRDQRSERMPNLPPEFERFFGDGLFERYFEQQVPQQGYVQRGSGSGVIVSPDGFILTNSHVIRNADEVQVRLEDGRDFPAKVVGNDPRSEIAVIRIQATGLTAAKLGNSEELKVGQWVLAIGNPLHLAQTVTAGIVSARGRSNIGITDFENFIQTDAAINPGNSGGPLINLEGEVIGINTAIATRTGGYMGIGFAIPSNMVQKVMDQLIEHGRVARGLLGVVVQSLTADLAKTFGFRGVDGVLVADVSPDGPAAKAGLQSGDIIRKVNGKTVTSTTELRNTVAELSPGTVVKVDYYRNHKQATVQVKLAALDSTDSSSDDGAAVKSEPNDEEQLGIKLQDATPSLMEQLGNPPQQAGVIVTQTTPGGPAHDAGLSASDVIVSVNGEAVSNTAEFRAAIAKVQAAGVRLQVLRQGRLTFAFLKLPKNDESVAEE